MTGAGSPADGLAPVRRILHVTESLGAGVATAIGSYADNSQWADHYLLAAVRAGEDVGIDMRAKLKGVWIVRRKWEIPFRLRRLFARLEPDHVHAHSSYGGAFARLSLLPRGRIIYTPHCYSFERRDVGWPMRLAFSLMEQALSVGGRRIAAVSEREARLAARMLGRPEVILLPNCASVPAALIAASRKASGPPIRVAMMGRITAQKGADFFAATHAALGRLSQEFRFVWLGGGAPERERALRSQGVAVSGWQPRAATLRALSECDVYLHSAAWEGMPLSLLEAAALRLPIVARHIPALEGLDGLRLVRSPDEAAAALAALRDDAAREALAQAAGRLNLRFSREAQAAALARLYGAAAPAAVWEAGAVQPAPLSGRPGRAGQESRGAARG